MKKTLLTLTAATLLLLPAKAENIPAFPGAEGHGAYTTGGRGGEIRHVTNLNDHGAGSLRAALEGDTPKTIVFDVSGYIDLESQLDISSNTTIAGQTAPEGGITLRYHTLYFGKCDNVIVRFIRCRRSQVRDVNDGADAAWGRNRHNIIIDHCSFSWSIDEVASFYDNRDFTLQWCTLAEGLANPGHSKGSHSYGGIWGGKCASFHHNLIAHVHNRAPRFNGARYGWQGYDTTRYSSTMDAERVDFRNCVIYNWGNGAACYGGPGGGYVNIVNNYYKAGPATQNRTRVTEVSVSNSGNADSRHPELYGYASRYFIQGNYMCDAPQPENYDWQGVLVDKGLVLKDDAYYIPDAAHQYGAQAPYVQVDGTDCLPLRLTAPVETGPITTHSAQEAYERVLKYAGASLYRDATDARYVEETRNGTVTYHADAPGILNVINDPEGTQDDATASFPPLPGATRSADFDTDRDGMPDEWELANGLDPKNPQDANAKTLDTQGWYTNVEVYLNSLVQRIVVSSLIQVCKGLH